MLDDILRGMEEGGEDFNKTAEYDQASVEDMLKEAEAQGRQTAAGLAFIMNKIAVETHPANITGDAGQLPGNMNPAVQVSTAGGAVGGPASAVINSLISRTGHNGGIMQGPAGTIGAAGTTVNAPPSPAEIARAQVSAQAQAKTASDYIIESLYQMHLA